MLLRPLVNRDEDRLIYIRQSAPGLGAENTTFSVPEIDDLNVARHDDRRLRRLLHHRLHDDRLRRAPRGAGRRRQRLVLRGHGPSPRARPPARRGRRWPRRGGRGGPDPPLLEHLARTAIRPSSARPSASARAPRRWSACSSRRCRIPADTEIIANVVTSPHHLGATMVTERTHRMTELFGRLAPGATLEAARAELTAVHAAMMREHPEAYSAQRRRAAERHAAARSDRGAGADRSCSCCSPRPRPGVRHRLLERREPDPGALGAPRRRAGRARRARREPRRAAADAARREPGALRRRRGAGRAARAPARRASSARYAVALLGARARRHGRRQPAVGRRRPGDGRGRRARLRPAPAVGAGADRIGARERQRADHARHQPPAAGRSRSTQIALSFVLLAGAGMLLAALVALQTANTGYNMRQVLALDVPTAARDARHQVDRLLPGSDAADRRAAGRGARRASATSCPGATPAAASARSRSPSRATRPPTAKRTRARGCASSRPASSRRSASRCSPAATSPTTIARGSELVVIVSQSVAQRLFPDGDALNRQLWWTDPSFGKPTPRRIVGVVADVDDENVVPGPALTRLSPVSADAVRAAACSCTQPAIPYALVPPVTRIIRELSRGPAGGARRDARGRARRGAGARAAERASCSPDSPASRC